ncbi:MAG: hypothetical protein U9O56_02265 [Campylobacterota bacterium]|nr:hypothetical protein [Campylobacterota bacterium]
MIFKKNILILLFISFSTLLYFSIDKYKEKIVDEHLSNLYLQAQEKMLNNYKIIYQKYYNDSLEKSIALVNVLNIRNKINNPNTKFEYFNSDDTIIKIFNKDGYQIFSNELIDYDTDNKNPQYIKNFILDKHITSEIIQNKRGLFITHLIPIFDKEFIGVFQVNINFDVIVNKLLKKDLKTIILLNKIDSSKIDLNLSHSRKFLDNFYVVNKNNDKYYLKVLEQSKIYQNQHLDKTIDQNSDVAIVKSIIGNNLANVYIIKSLDDIKIDNLNFIINLIDIVLWLIIFILLIFLYIFYRHIQNKYYILENNQLSKENKELRLISEKLDLNEKKLSNLFNLQPNIMFISNGINIVQVNRRFMGFFRRYKSFENFKHEHNCISELFEQTDLPHYITSSLIDGKNWLEYILENPKKLYKTIMSVDDEAHHFIIKVNEMEYVRQFHERYIVVAFVDITQDIKDKETTNNNYSCEINSEFDISYTIENNITKTLFEYTNIKPTKQSIFKSTLLDELDNNCVFTTLELKTDDIVLNWKLIISVDTLSYIQNISSYNYDAKIITNINDDLKDIAYILSDNMAINMINDITKSKNSKLSNISHSIIKEVKPYKEIAENTYKFSMFIDNREVDIFIEFDKASLFYIRQIQMLGAFFNNEL